MRPPGFEPGIAGLEGQVRTSGGFLPSPAATFVISYPAIRQEFLEWLKSKNYSKVHERSIINYLDKYVTVIQKPMDVINVFAGLTRGQQHQLNRAVRALFNFCEVMGVDEGFLRSLRKAVPKDVTGFDLNVPTEQEVIDSLRLVARAPQLKDKAAYNMALDSGLRITEIAKLMKSFNSTSIEAFNGFYVAPLGYFRTSKLAYFAFFTDYTFNLMQGLTEKDMEILNDRNIGSYFRNVAGFEQVLRFKYLRKFANDIMTSEELNIPESVADFIQGRTPKSVGARHYMKLKRKALQFYPRYAKYVDGLRQKAGLIKA